MKIFICNGLPQSGKTTFQNLCKHLYKGNVHIISTVDFVKYVASVCGWDNKKTPKNRKFLSDLKDLLTEWNDVPWQKVAQELRLIRLSELSNDPSYEPIVFIDSREPPEIERFCKAYNAKSILVTRPDSSTPEEQSNHADANVLNYDYDYIINNCGTIDHLEKIAQSFLNNL